MSDSINDQIAAQAIILIRQRREKLEARRARMCSSCEIASAGDRETGDPGTPPCRYLKDDQSLYCDGCKEREEHRRQCSIASARYNATMRRLERLVAKLHPAPAAQGEARQ